MAEREEGGEVRIKGPRPEGLSVPPVPREVYHHPPSKPFCIPWATSMTEDSGEGEVRKGETSSTLRK